MLGHLLDIRTLSKAQLEQLLLNAQSFVEVSTRDVKKVPALRGKTVVNLFLEPSTRTRTSFEIAGKRLSADVINISEGGSSVSKGETLLDTARTLQSMSPEILVIRHKESGSAHFLANYLESTAVVNAGDGQHEHPTQALLDCLTLMEHFKTVRKTSGIKSIEGLTVAIVGDIRHSRVARSNIWAHLLLGNRVRLVGPTTLLPAEFQCPTFLHNSLPQQSSRSQQRMPFSKSAPVPASSDLSISGSLECFHDLRKGLAGADVVMCLRLQLERQNEDFIPSLTEYSREFGVSEKILAAVAPHSVVLHPGPANRGIEASSEVLDGPRSLVTAQVTHGVAVRMAVLFALGTSQHERMGMGEEMRT